jgi:hypothetical protein
MDAIKLRQQLFNLILDNTLRQGSSSFSEKQIWFQLLD